jgi:hypothetical protein
MGERVIKDKFNIHETYRKMNITNPYRFGGGAPANSYILDTYDDARFAISFRKLRGSYSGDCIRVHRSSDATELDIGFVNDYIDTTALLNFVGSGTGYIVKFYDQSVYGTDLVSAAGTTFSPTVVINGVLNEVDGKVSMKSNSSSYKLRLTPLSLTTITDFQVIKDNTGSMLSIGNGQSNSDYYGFMQGGSGHSITNNNSSNVVYYVNNSEIINPNRGSLSTAITKSTPVLFTTKIDIPSWNMYQTAYASATSVKPIENLFEQILFPTDRSDKIAINDAINSYYSLY